MSIATKTRFQTGGNFGSPKMDLGKCVFFAQFWRPDLAGSPFQSLSPYGIPTHTCTVTGATWGSQGRTFAGAGQIVTPTVAVGTGFYTMSCVVKVAALPGTYYCLIGGDTPYAGLIMSPTGFSVGRLGVSTGSDVAYTIPLNTSLMVTAVVKGAGLPPDDSDIWVNGALIGTSTEVNGYAMANRIFRFGAATGVADIPFSGVMGEAQVYTGDQSASEMHRYLTTKWRF